MEASFAAGGTSHWLIVVVARDRGECRFGSAGWTYRPQPPDVIRGRAFPTYWRLESQQQQHAIAIGDVHPDVLCAGEVVRESYEAGLQALRPDATFGALNEAMEEPVRAAGGWALTPHVYSLNPMVLVGGCGLSSKLPDVDAYGTLGEFTTRGAEAQLKPGFTFAFQPNCTLGRRRVNVAGTVVLTNQGPREFNSLPNEIHRV